MLQCAPEGAKMETVFTVEEVAAMLKVTPFTVRRWLKEGQIRGIKFGKLWRICESDLDVFLEARKTKKIAE